MKSIQNTVQSKLEVIKLENINRRLDIHIIVGIRELIINVLAVSKLSDEDIRMALSKVIRQNDIEYDHLISLSNQRMPKEYNVMIKLIENKMLEKDIEIYIFCVRRAELANKPRKLTKEQIVFLVMFFVLTFGSLAYWITGGFR